LRKRDREHLLLDFQRKRGDCTLEEAERLLRAYGFLRRAASKEASVWKRGNITLTLPRPKGRVLLVAYVALVLRKIREAEMLGIPEEQQP